MKRKDIIVIIAKGKGHEHATYITPKLFETTEEAETYIKEVNDLESKHWTYAEIVKDGSEIEPYFGEF